MDIVVLSSLHLSSADKAQSARSVPTTQVMLGNLITWCVTKPEIKFSCSGKDCSTQISGYQVWFKNSMLPKQWQREEQKWYILCVRVPKHGTELFTDRGNKEFLEVPRVSGASIYGGKKATFTHGQRIDNQNKWHEKSYCPKLPFHEGGSCVFRVQVTLPKIPACSTQEGHNFPVIYWAVSSWGDFQLLWLEIHLGITLQVWRLEVHQKH